LLMFFSTSNPHYKSVPVMKKETFVTGGW